MTKDRGNWIPQKVNGIIGVIDKLTYCVIYTNQEFGFKTEEKCWNWIRNMQKQVGINISEPERTSTPTSDPLF
jgi:hypothetical protein